MSTHEQRQRRRAKKGTGVMRYRDTVTLFDAPSAVHIEEIAEKVREVGKATVGVALHIEIEADDLWQLREALDEVETYLASEGIHWTPAQEKVDEVER